MPVWLFLISKSHNSKKNVSQGYGSCALHRLVLINKFMKFRHNILNGFYVTEWTRLDANSAIFHFKGPYLQNTQFRVMVFVFCSWSHVV